MCQACSVQIGVAALVCAVLRKVLKKLNRKRKK